MYSWIFIKSGECEFVTLCFVYDDTCIPSSSEAKVRRLSRLWDGKRCNLHERAFVTSAVSFFFFFFCLFSQRWTFVDRIAMFITWGQYFSLNKATAWITMWFKEQSQSGTPPNAVAWICIADCETQCITAREQGGKMYLNLPPASLFK